MYLEIHLCLFNGKSKAKSIFEKGMLITICFESYDLEVKRETNANNNSRQMFIIKFSKYHLCIV